MKNIFLTVWAAVCTVWASTAGTCLAFASEQAEQPSKIMLSMDVIQTVSLVLVITVAVVIFALYVVKRVLMKIPAASEANEEKKTDHAKEE